MLSQENTIKLRSGDKKHWKEGWDESVDEAMAKPMFHRVSYAPRLSLNGILISLLCTFLLIFLGFVIVPLPSPFAIGLEASIGLPFIQYSFQMPLALMIAALMGPYMGTLSIFLFLLTGLAFYPVFANGGGWDYIHQPGFGYLVATFLVGHWVARTFHKTFQKQSQPSRSLRIFLMALMAVAFVHVLGLLSLTILAMAGQLPWPDLLGWALRLTVETAPYDFLATAVFFCMVRQIRLALWLVLY